MYSIVIIIIIIIGIRLLGSNYAIDSQEAGALTHNWNDIHVYSNSWGPNDNGLTLSGPDQDSLVTEAFFEGVNRVFRRI